MTNAGGDGGMPHSGGDEPRLAALEAELHALRGEVRELRNRVGRIEPSPTHSADAPATGTAKAQSHLADALRSASAPNIRRPSLSGDAVESWVGRYGTLVAAALVILLRVGTLVVWPVQRGLLSPGLR